jgi:hypothetical protein
MKTIAKLRESDTGGRAEVKLPVLDTRLDSRPSAAGRIYDIHCRIVHAKAEFDADGGLPPTDADGVGRLYHGRFRCISSANWREGGLNRKEIRTTPCFNYARRNEASSKTY